MNDLAFGVRLQLKTPVATLASVATLAFAIAASGVTFSLVNAFFLRPLPVERPDELVRIYSSFAGGQQYFTVSYPDFTDLRALDGVFTGALAEQPVPVTVGGGGVYERVWGEAVSEGYFPVLGVGPACGRLFVPADEAPGAPPVVVMGYGLWQRRFGGNRDIAGETLLLNGRPFTIVGVAPRGFYGINLGLQPDFWLPAGQQEPGRPGDVVTRRGARAYFVMGRLAPGVGLEQARAALDVLAGWLQQAYPATNDAVRFTALAESDGRVHPLARSGLLGLSAVLVGVVALVLLIACANVAGALLVRAAARRREVGVRLALGATRGRIVRQLLIENVLLAAAAGGLGVALAWAVVRTLSAVHVPIARGASLAIDVGLDARVIGFSVAITVVTALLFGLTPAIEASRADLITVLKAGDAAAGRRPARLRHALIAAQVAFSMVLLIGAGLFLRSLQQAQHADLGFTPGGVVMMSVDLSPRRYSPEETARFWRQLVDRVGALRGAQAVGLGDRVPLELNITTTSLAPEGYEPPAEGGWPTFDFAVVDAGYFHTLDVPVLEGRAFDERDAGRSPPVVIVNDVLARRFWPHASAVGQFLTTRAGQRSEVVGVVRRTTYLALAEEPRPYVFFPVDRRRAQTLTVIARTGADPTVFLRDVRDVVRAIDDTVPFYNVTTLDQYAGVALMPARAGATVLNLVGLVALVLTSLGLYGTVAYSAGRRTYEIGVRRALGAQDGHIVWLVTRQAVVLVAVGVAGGIAAGLAGARLLGSMLYGVAATDPFVFSLAPVVLVLVCVLASWAPTARAIRLDAARALRHE